MHLPQGGSIFGAVLGRTLVIISDAHLGVAPPGTEEALLEFLEAVPELGDCLLINGDLFTHVIAYSHPLKSAALEIFRGNQRALARPSGTHAWQGGHPEAGPTLGPWRATVAAAAPRLRGDIPAARVHSAHRS